MQFMSDVVEIKIKTIHKTTSSRY